MSQSAENKQQGLFLTQEDIDAALRGSSTSEATVEADENDALILDEADIIDSDSEDSDYFGLLSQEDIEALLHGDLAGSPEEDAQGEFNTLPADEGSETGDASKAVDGPSEGSDAVQDDVEEFLQKTVAGVDEETEAVAPEAPAEGLETEKEAETSEGGEAVSQDDIDRLLMSAIDDSEEEEGEAPEAAAPPAPDEGEMVSQDDINSLLAGAMDLTETESDIDETPIEAEETPASPDDADSPISQADLDQLMNDVSSGDGIEDTPSESDDAQSEHISQGDINKLLKESLEAETVSEEEAEPDPVDEVESTEPVILAADEEAPEEDVPSDPKPPTASTLRKKITGAFTKKRFLVGAAAGILFAVSASIVTMFSGREETVLQPRVLTFSVSQSDSGGFGALSSSGKSVHLAGFIILAPPNSAAITYVTGDLLLDLADASLVDLIKENEAYVRDIIYGTINSELMTRDISTIDEISLELAIRRELGRIIPREAIERIDFEGFSLA